MAPWQEGRRRGSGALKRAAGRRGSMAEETARKRVPMLYAEGRVGMRRLQEAGGGPREELSLKIRMQKLKEGIIKEAVSRQAEMSDREEAWTLRAALEALKAGDAGRARELLAERLAQVERRTAEREPFKSELDADSEEEEGEEVEEGEGEEGVTEAGARGDELEEAGEQAKVAGRRGAAGAGQGGLRGPAPLLKTVRQCNVLSASYWEGLTGGDLHARCSELPSVVVDNTAAPAPELRESLLSHGYMCSGPCLPAEDMGQALRAMRAVEAAHWPPAFAFMYDEVWALVAAVWPKVEALLGGECTLEPSFAGFHVKFRSPEARYMGTNFALPHRDYTYADSTFADGSPKIMSLWIPMNDVTLDNGCMYVVPKEFDTNFARDSAYEHMQVLTEGGLKGQQFLHFPLDVVRPLPAGSGSLMGWWGNLIHWGSSCTHRGMADPRASLAFVFRRADAAHDLEQPCLRRADLEAFSLADRLLLVHQALGFFRHWYTVPDDLRAALKLAETSINEGELHPRVPKPSEAARGRKEGYGGGHNDLPAAAQAVTQAAAARA